MQLILILLIKCVFWHTQKFEVTIVSIIVKTHDSRHLYLQATLTLYMTFFDIYNSMVHLIKNLFEPKYNSF